MLILCLTSLTGCISGPSVKTEYIRPTIPPLPPKNEYYPVKWEKDGDGYRMDAESAKNTLKNEALHDDREAQLEEIIEGIR